MRNRFYIYFLFIGWFVLSAYSAHANTIITITPSGDQPYYERIPVIIMVSFDQPINTLPALEKFYIRYNGLDVTNFFIDRSIITPISDRAIQLETQLIFPPGTHTLSVELQFVGEKLVVQESSFTIPGDQQEQYRNTLLAKISQFIHQYDNYLFGSWISLGDITPFRKRINDGQIQIYIDKDYLENGGGAVAAYVEKYVWKYVYTIYDQDIILAAPPSTFSIDDSTNQSGTLWHEAIHAISHGLQLAGTSPLTADDHTYIGWAESCIEGLFHMTKFEKFVQEGGLIDPPDDISKKARIRWKQFIKNCSESVYGTLPTKAQKAEFKTMIGFYVDPITIKKKYLDLGVPREYFENIKVILDTPATTETSETTIDLTGIYTSRDGSTVNDSDIQHIYFQVNGKKASAATFSNGNFSGSIGLNEGENNIIAVLVLTNGETIKSNSIKIKSTNQIPITITLSWDKSKVDVDLWLENSSGSLCYYDNPNPDWGVSGDTLDDPELDRDCIDSCNIEHINLRSMIPGETYIVKVHYYSANDLGSTNAFISVVVNGQVVFSSNKTLREDEVWEVFRYTHPTN